MEIITQREINEAIAIAKNLKYGKDIIKRIKDAKTLGEINRALKAGRDRL